MLFLQTSHTPRITSAAWPTKESWVSTASPISRDKITTRRSGGRTSPGSHRFSSHPGGKACTSCHHPNLKGKVEIVICLDKNLMKNELTYALQEHLLKRVRVIVITFWSLGTCRIGARVRVSNGVAFKVEVDNLTSVWVWLQGICELSMYWNIVYATVNFVVDLRCTSTLSDFMLLIYSWIIFLIYLLPQFSIIIL